MGFFFFCRDNGVKAIENLMQKRGKFDYILLETTGLADPGSSRCVCFFIRFYKVFICTAVTSPFKMYYEVVSFQLRVWVAV